MTDRERIAEPENLATDTNVPTKKPKRKFRAMTIGEFCKRFNKDCDECPYYHISCGFEENKPCKPYGKYILIEVKE